MVTKMKKKSKIFATLMLLVIMVVFAAFYIMMHIYFYQFAITFELSFSKTLKNSLIMAVAYLPLNILIMAIPLVLTCILCSFITITVVLMFSLFFWIAFMRYPIEFLASRVILNKLLTKTGVNDIFREQNKTFKKLRSV